MERVVGVVILSIEDEDGRILVQIGEEKDGVATPCVPVRLPGLRVQETIRQEKCDSHRGSGNLKNDSYRQPST